MIYIVWGHPGQGKSYSTTAFCVDALNHGRKVFSNYPICTSKGKRSMKWKPEYARLQQPPTDCIIAIDEAYRDYNSRKTAGFTTEEHTFFATNRHNKLDIYLCVQNPARVDIVIREISQFILCSKIGISRFIIGFRLFYYETIDDIAARKAGKTKQYYRKEFLWFKKSVARSYDTHYYGIKNPKEFQGELWEYPEGFPIPGQKKKKKQASVSKKEKNPTYLTDEEIQVMKKIIEKEGAKT